MKATSRRQVLKALALTGVTAALPQLASGSIMGKRKPIREFGRVYDYLKDAQLRLKEKQNDRIVIENAEFNGEEFINVAWGYCDFVNCHFPGSHVITLTQLANCNFIDCGFGPSRDDDSLDFGDSRDSVFRRCKFFRANAGLPDGNAHFEQCEFMNPNEDPNHSYALGGDDLSLVKCETKNYNILVPGKLMLQDCTIHSRRLSSRSRKKGVPIVADFKFINTTFEDGEEILWGTELKNLTMSRCVAKGVFRTQGCVVKNTALLEHLREGFFDLSWTSVDGKLHVRNCIFSDKGRPPERERVKTDCIFICAGTVPVETVVERITCRSEAVCNLTSAHDGQKFDLSTSRHKNKVFIVRDCQIPYLKINWLKTKHLRLENCEIGQLEIRDGQIGKLEIVKTKFGRLDLSRTVATEYALEVSGEVVDTGSNYDKATGKARKK
jgi:hypothetical protein